ncbi:MAG: efflux RND transporter periplasmic adaptor subunit [Candidatus Krumholzibacteriota bacterium]|nr:efflux RND transporter periplasmic adaptor subunit [Candidatus Krumholzibacteriota bacterium]
MKRKRLIIGGGIVVVVVGALGAVMALRGGGDESLSVQTAMVTREKIVQKVTATGKIQPKTQVKISADVSAKITKLAVVEGQWVEKGQFLVELDRERYLAQVESAEASLRSAQANAAVVRETMAKAEKDFTRSKELVAQNLESQAAYDDKEAAYRVEVSRYASLQSQTEQAQAVLKQTRDDLSKTIMYAPMAGTISDLNKEQGEIAIGSQFQEDVILIISDLSEMEAQVNVDENDIVSIAIDQMSEIEVDALLDQVLVGVVYEIANSANVGGEGSSDQKTEFEIKISITDPPKTLRPGMTASADVFTKTNENALSVPIQSVAVRTVDQLTMADEDPSDAEARYTADRDGFVEVVFCIEDGKAIAKQVKTGIQSDELIEILEGLEEGDEVVTGSYRAISRDLENGAVVKIDNEDGHSDEA